VSRHHHPSSEEPRCYHQMQPLTPEMFTTLGKNPRELLSILCESSLKTMHYSPRNQTSLEFESPPHRSPHSHRRPTGVAVNHTISNARPRLEAAYPFIFIKSEMSILISTTLSQSASWTRGPKSTDLVYKPIPLHFPFGKQFQNS
jgi:hypothetical protein